MTQLCLTVLDYGVWRSLRQRGLDEVAELTTLLEFVVQPQSPRPTAKFAQHPSPEPNRTRAINGALSGGHPRMLGHKHVTQPTVGARLDC